MKKWYAFFLSNWSIYKLTRLTAGLREGLFTKQDAENSKNNSIYLYLVITYSFYKFRYRKGGSNIAESLSSYLQNLILLAT